MNANVPGMKTNRPQARLWRRPFVCVVVVSQEAPDGAACLAEMFDVKVQVHNTTLRTSMNDFQLNLTEGCPFWGRVGGVCRSIRVTSSLPGHRPRPRNVQALEVDLLTALTQSMRIGHHAEQCAVSALPARDIYEHMSAWLHQIEPLTMNIL